MAEPEYSPLYRSPVLDTFWRHFYPSPIIRTIPLRYCSAIFFVEFQVALSKKSFHHSVYAFLVAISCIVFLFAYLLMHTGVYIITCKLGPISVLILYETFYLIIQFILLGQHLSPRYCKRISVLVCTNISYTCLALLVSKSLTAVI